MGSVCVEYCRESALEMARTNYNQGLDLDTQSLSHGLDFFHRTSLLGPRPQDSHTGHLRRHFFEQFQLLSV